MSSFIKGTHLTVYSVAGQNSPKELEGFGEWTASANFEPINEINDALGRCAHKDRHQRLRPILKELNFKARNFYRE